MVRAGDGRFCGVGSRGGLVMACAGAALATLAVIATLVVALAWRDEMP